MRPHRPTAKSKAKGLARARRYFQDALWWLRGFPLEELPDEDSLLWTIAPPAGGSRGIEVIRLTPEQLRSATYAMHRLLDAFPRALPRLVGDREAWRIGVTRILETLKRPINAREALPSVETLLDDAGLDRGLVRSLRELTTREPSLAPVARALVWIHLGKPSGLVAPLRFLSRQATRLAAIVRSFDDPEAGRRSLLHLCEVAGADGEERLDGVIEWTAAELEISDGSATATTGALAGWIQRIVRDAPNTRRAALRLLDVVRPRQLLVERKRHLALQRSPRQAEILEAESRPPPCYPDSATVLDAIRKLAGTWSTPRLRNLESALAALPELHANGATRPQLLVYWLRLEVHQPSSTRLDRWIRTFRDMVRERPSLEGIIDPWIGPPGRDGKPDWRHDWNLPEYELLHEIPPHGKLAISRFGEISRAVDWLASRAPTDRAAAASLARLRSSFRTLTMLVGVVQDGEIAGAIFHSLAARLSPRDLSTLEHGVCAAAGELAGEDRARFAELVVRLEEVRERRDDGLEALVHLARSVPCPTTRRDLTLEILEGRASGVLDVARRFRLAQGLSPDADDALLAALAAAIPPAHESVADSTPEWIERYAEPLRPELLRLARVDPEARRRAARILDSTFPDPERCRSEAEALRARIREAPGPRVSSLAARLAAIERWQETPPPVSETRLETLGRKIRRRVASSQLQAWDQLFRATLRERLAAELGLDPDDAWLEDERIVRILPGVPQLPDHFRELLFRVLRRRTGPAPWDFRDAPENEGFLARLRASGLDPEPWIQGIGFPIDETDSKLSGWKLALENDPLESLLLGAHFGTCLTPGSFNFFSAVSIAVDINKRVLFARDREGRVMGRCLLALTPEGRLLTFNAYCHDGAIGFDRIAGAFALELATRMGTSCAADGRVETLVANDWYDDGPADLTGRHAFLADAGFRARLATLAPGELPAVLLEELTRTDLDAHVLRTLASLPELHSRPELALGLVPLLHSVREVETDTVLDVADLLLRAKRADEARALHDRLLRRIGPADRYESPRLAKAFLAWREPTLALRCLRETRRGRGRRERHADRTARLEIAAQANEELKRFCRALRLYRSIPPNERSHEIRSRIAALESRLGGGRGA